MITVKAGLWSALGKTSNNYNRGLWTHAGLWVLLHPAGGHMAVRFVINQCAAYFCYVYFSVCTISHLKDEYTVDICPC